MKKGTLHRVVSGTLSAALMSGMLFVGTAQAAFTYPAEYWKIHSAWEQAVVDENPDQVIAVAQQTYDLLMKYGLCMDVCQNLEPKCARAAWCAQMKGDISGAIKWLERQRVFAQWLDQNWHSYKDALLSIDSQVECLEAALDCAVYVLTDEPGLSYPDSGAPVSGTLYGSVVEGSQSGESAVLTYITFRDGYSVEYWLNYYKATNKKFKQAATENGVIELAWNFSPENNAGMDRVLEAEADQYIKAGLQAMGRLKATVLLRVGAEMNVWNDSDSAKYIQAFQKIAREAKQYDNVKLVFSPNDVSNRNVSFTDFYPGDEYVDWISMSTYHNSNYKTQRGNEASYDFNVTGCGDDAYYGVGNYDSDPLLTIRPIVEFAAEHGKPVMIGECGFAYKDNTSGLLQTEFAADQLNKFYSYVNMVYPQVKAVFYFDYSLDGGRYSYHLAGSKEMQGVYANAIEQNGGYLDWGETGGKTWKKLSEVSAQEGTLRLAAYAGLPGKQPSTATYYVDGKEVFRSSTVPVYYDLDVSALAPGRHTVTAVIRSGQFSVTTQTYTVGKEAPVQPVFSDVNAGDWFKPYVDKVAAAGLMSGMGSGSFGAKEKLQVCQAMVMAYQIHSKATGGTLPKAEGEWFMPYYRYCLDNGIVTQEQFPQSSLKQSASRFDMVTILDKAIPDARMQAVKEVADGAIPDLAEGDPCGAAVYRWYRAGLVSGSDEKGTFFGNSSIIRAEVAVILCKINGLI